MGLEWVSYGHLRHSSGSRDFFLKWISFRHMIEVSWKQLIMSVWSDVVPDCLVGGGHVRISDF